MSSHRKSPYLSSVTDDRDQDETNEGLCDAKGVGKLVNGVLDRGRVELKYLGVTEKAGLRQDNRRRSW